MLESFPQIRLIFGENNLISILLLVVLLSIFVNLYLAQKIILLRQRKITKEKFITLLKDFFSNQIFQTQNTSHHNKRNHFDKNVMRLRHAYMAIERGCLDRGIDSQGYWELLHSKLKKLLAIYENHQTNGIVSHIKENISLLLQLLDKCPESKSKSKVRVALHKLESACEAMPSNPERLLNLNSKILKLLSKFSNEFHREISYISDAGTTYIDNTINPVNRIKQHTDTIHSISNYSTENQPASVQDSMTSLSDTSRVMQVRIRELEEKLKSAKETLSSHISSYDQNSNKDAKILSRDIRDISEEIIAASEREIDRLNKLLGDKKLIICELEEALNSTSNKQKQDEKPTDSNIHLTTEHQEDIDLLRRNLLESEQCIALLECELDTLKGRMLEANNLKGAPITEAEIDTLNKTITGLKEEVTDYESAWKEKHLLVNYVIECLDAGTTEDVSLSIYQCLLDMGFTSNLLVYTPERTLEINDIGAIAKKDKLLVNSMQIGEVNLSKNDKRFHFRWKTIGGIIFRNDSHTITNKEKENLVELSHLTDKILHRIQLAASHKQNQKSLDSVCNSIKYLTRELDQSFEQVFSKVDNKLHDSFGQLQDIARSSGMNATHIASLKSLENSVSEEIQAEKRIKLRMHKAMLSLLQKVEKLED